MEKIFPTESGYNLLIRQITQRTEKEEPFNFQTPYEERSTSQISSSSESFETVSETSSSGSDNDNEDPLKLLKTQLSTTLIKKLRPELNAIKRKLAKTKSLERAVLEETEAKKLLQARLNNLEHNFERMSSYIDNLNTTKQTHSSRYPLLSQLSHL